MLTILLPALLCLLPATPGTQADKPQADKPQAEAKALSFTSFKLPFSWNQVIPIKDAELDGLKINSIYFNTRSLKLGPLKAGEFGTRARVEVTNTSDKPRSPVFAVAVFDEDDRLIGVATGGTKIGPVHPGEIESFDLSFHQVNERLPKGSRFYLAVELTD